LTPSVPTPTAMPASFRRSSPLGDLASERLLDLAANRRKSRRPHRWPSRLRDDPSWPTSHQHLRDRVLRRPVESGKYTPFAFTQRLIDEDSDASVGSVGSVGDGYDNALADSQIGATRPS
jgi:hypothetical protein